MPSTQIFHDGDYSTPKKVAPNTVLYPLAPDANYQAKEIVETHLVKAGVYSPLALNTTGGAAGFYLVEERVRDGLSDKALTQFNRYFSNVPAIWTGYSSLLLSKPSTNMGSLTEKAYGDFWVKASGANTVNVLGASGAVTNVTSLYPTGGTFTLTFSGQTTTALSASANAVTISNAFNALAAVQSAHGFTVTTGTPSLQQLSFFISGGSPILGDITLNIDNLIPTGASTTISRANNGGIQTFSPRLPYLDYTAASHGLVFGDVVGVGSASSVSIVSPSEILSANVFRVQSQSMLGNIYRRYIRSYVEGSVRVRTRNVHSYYLPGITAGINSAEDIPLPSVRSDDYSFLTTVFSGGSGYLIWDASNLDRYRGNIYEQVTTSFRVSDV